MKRILNKNMCSNIKNYKNIFSTSLRRSSVMRIRALSDDDINKLYCLTIRKTYPDCDYFYIITAPAVQRPRRANTSNALIRF